MFAASVQENVVIALQLEEWIKMSSVDGTLTSEWCAIVAAKLSMVNPYCSFGFKRAGCGAITRERRQLFGFELKRTAPLVPVS